MIDIRNCCSTDRGRGCQPNYQAQGQGSHRTVTVYGPGRPGVIHGLAMADADGAVWRVRWYRMPSGGVRRRGGGGGEEGGKEEGVGGGAGGGWRYSVTPLL